MILYWFVLINNFKNVDYKDKNYCIFFFLNKKIIYFVAKTQIKKKKQKQNKQTINEEFYE